MFKTSIKRRVMDVINQSIESAQQSHDSKMEALETKHEAEKNDLTDSTVRDFLSKFRIPK